MRRGVDRATGQAQTGAPSDLSRSKIAPVKPVPLKNRLIASKAPNREITDGAPTGGHNSRLRAGRFRLQELVVNELKASLQGPLLCPGDAGYNDARQVWNCLGGDANERPHRS